MMTGLMVLMFTMAPSFAADSDEKAIVIRRAADIFKALPPEGARRWSPAALIAATEASTRKWTPTDTYELVDHGKVPEEVIQIVANKAGVFYDPEEPTLPQVREKGRAKAQPQTIVLTQANFDSLFSSLINLKKEAEVAAESLGDYPTKAATETKNAYERRLRVYDIQTAELRAPIEGKFEKTTFEITLPAKQANRGGCERAVAEYNADHLPFDTFRGAAGSIHSTVEVPVRTHSIDKVYFLTSGGRRFEVWSKCADTAKSVSLSIHRTWDGKWSGEGNF